MSAVDIREKHGLGRYKPYPRYEDSAIDWLQAIPCHWSVKPFGFSADFIVPMRDKPEDLRGDTPWIRIEDFDGQYIGGSSSGQGVSDQTIRQMNLKVFPAGTVLCSCSCSMGATAIVTRPLVSNQTFIGIVPGPRLISAYVYYLMQVAREHLTALASGAIQQYLSRNHFSSLRMPILPIGEQEAIAAFLDRQTAKIDALVAKKERLIELLEEKRAAVITQAVTKGLDSTVRMKDSGVAWLGEIPAHWQVLRLRRVMRKFVDYRGKTPEKTASGVQLVTAKNIKNQTIDFSLSEEFIPEHLYDEWMIRGFPECGDVLLTTEAPLGECAQINDPSIALAQRIILLKADKGKMTNDYLMYHFVSDSGQSELQTNATGSTALGIKASHLKETLVLVPPVPEQEDIASHIGASTAPLNAVISKTRDGTERLKEYRTALISAAVTGKIDVRGEAA